MKSILIILELYDILWCFQSKQMDYETDKFDFLFFFFLTKRFIPWSFQSQRLAAERLFHDLRSSTTFILPYASFHHYGNTALVLVFSCSTL